MSYIVSTKRKLLVLMSVTQIPREREEGESAAGRSAVDTCQQDSVLGGLRGAPRWVVAPPLRARPASQLVPVLVARRRRLPAGHPRAHRILRLSSAACRRLRRCRCSAQGRQSVTIGAWSTCCARSRQFSHFDHGPLPASVHFDRTRRFQCHSL